MFSFGMMAISDGQSFLHMVCKIQSLKDFMNFRRHIPATEPHRQLKALKWDKLVEHSFNPMDAELNANTIKKLHFHNNSYHANS